MSKDPLPGCPMISLLQLDSLARDEAQAESRLARIRARRDDLMDQLGTIVGRDPWDRTLVVCFEAGDEIAVIELVRLADGRVATNRMPAAMASQPFGQIRAALGLDAPPPTVLTIDSEVA